MDRLDALKVFCAVVDAGGFSRAAAKLGISTSSVSHQIGVLEAHFRVKLLNRTTRSMSPTDEGRRCVEQARGLLAEMDELETASCPTPAWWRAAFSRIATSAAPRRTSSPVMDGRSIRMN